LNTFDTIFIGAGASCLMALTQLNKKNIAVIESNSRVGKKIEISGGGKCNVTNLNVTSENYLGDSNFIQNTFNKYSNKDLLDFLDKEKLKLEERDNRQLFCKNSAKDLINILKQKIDASFFYNEIVKKVEKDSEDFIVTTNKNIYKAKKVVISSGGASYKSIGASEVGFDIAKSFGHKVNTISPALVGFTVQKEQFWFKNLSGISIRAKIKVDNKEFEENILFAHKGVSGPAILSASLYWKKGSLEIDFLPNIDIDKLLKKSDKNIATLLPLPKRFVLEFLTSVGVENKATKLLKPDERDKIKSLKSYQFSPAGNFGYTKAEATRGGVSVDEVTENFESKLVKNLFFIGEVLDITGELGGYNFQWAFSSGYICGTYLNKI
jgi:predicted Rossmann fold flavoprotein